MPDISGGIRGAVIMKNGVLYAWNGSDWGVVSLDALDATELGFLDGLTAGAVTASKALVVDANKDLATLRHLTLSGNLVSGSTTLAEADLAKIDAITNGTAAAGKALVADANIDIAGLRDVALRYLTSTGNVGTAGDGCTAQEFGNGYIFNTRIVINQTDAFTVADGAALADGHAIYTFPAGQILVLGAAITDCAVTLAEDSANAAAEFGLGTLVGSGANAELGLVGAGAENISGPITTAPCDGTAMSNVAGLAAPLAIADGDSHVVYANLASTWTDTAGVDLTGDLTGVVHLVWAYLGNPA